MATKSNMDYFCGSTFWNTSLTWNTDNPDFTPCFQKTVLVWIPCVYLWLAAVIEVYQMSISKESNIPRNKLNISKLVFTILLTLLQIMDICKVVYVSYKKVTKVFDADYYDPVVKFLTFVLSATLMSYNRKCGIRTSGVQFTFWLLLIVVGWPQLRTETIKYYGADDANQYTFASYILYYLLVLIMFMLNCFADLPPRNTPYTNYDEKQSPENSSGVPSRLTFSWFDPIVLTGYRRTLTENDLWPLNPQDVSKESIAKFEKFWLRALHNRESRTKASECPETAPLRGQRKESKPLSVFPMVCKAFGRLFLVGASFRIFNDVITFASPELLRLLIGFVEGNEPVWRGYLYAVSMFVCSFVQTLLMGQYFIKIAIVGVKINCALSSMVYKKALSLSNEAKRKSTVGEIINLMSTDVTRFSDLTFISWIWSAPLQITLALYFLWRQLGPSVLAGLAVIIILMPLNGYFAGMHKKLRTKLMQYKDERIKLMNEVLNGIKVLKIYAWEPSFQEYILKIRSKETKILKKIAYYDSLSSFVFFCTPVLISLMSFTCFVLVNDKEVLDSKRTFVALSLFNMLRFPMAILPNVISDIIQSYVSLKRLNKFLNSEELDTLMIEHNTHEPDQILIEGGHFSWGGEDAAAVLKKLNVRVPRGALVAVVGAVGSGKSSLLAALLGEMDKLSGRVNVKGECSSARHYNVMLKSTHKCYGTGECSRGEEFFFFQVNEVTRNGGQDPPGVHVGLSSGTGTSLPVISKTSYVAQQAWIQNATVQNNVLFGQPYNKTKYNQVIEACALKTDLAILPGGDQTEIGEKGINLSGGQKQRVSLARAVYCDADNYFLDDPLSAVDSHVGKEIFDNVIGPKGLLKNKTRIWVTHNISYLTQTDLVLVLRDGEVSESGSYQQLLDKKGAFADFLVHHLSVAEQTASDKDLENIKQDLECKPSTEIHRKIQWGRSLSSGARSTTSEITGEGDIDVKSSKDQLKENKVANEFDQFIQAEKAETGSVKWAVYMHYLSNVGVYASVGTLLIYILMQSFQILANFWLARWSNDKNMLVNGTMDTQLRDMYLGVYGAISLAQAIATLFSDLLPFLACWKAAKVLHEILLNNILRAPLQFFEVTPVGRILSRFSKDVDSVDTSLAGKISSTLTYLFEVIGTIFIISYSTPMFIAVIVPIGVLYYAVQRIYVPTSRQLMRMKSVARSPIFSHFNESLLGTTSIRAFGVKDRFLKESQRKVDCYQSFVYLITVANTWLSVRLQVVAGLIIFFAALFVVIGRESISPGLAGLSISYTLKITNSMRMLVQMVSTVETEIVAVERMKEYAETEQEAEWVKPMDPRPSWPETGSVQFEWLTMAYKSGAEPALRDVTCTVAPGDKLGIVGRTGAGKSTLTLGLFRILEPAGGRILIDGLDISKIGLHQLRSRITIIPQDPVLFSGSLRMNLDPFESYSDDDIFSALELSHLKPFVMGLQSGLLHEVTEGGENLSVGQRQLVCLARALLRKTPLLVLDEATAAIDLETDELIQKTIRSEFASCTVITIAHRLNTIMDSTKVMVLDKGQLIEYASPKQLLQDKTSMFYGLAQDAGLVS